MDVPVDNNPARDALRGLYDLFQKSLTEHPDMLAWKGQAVRDSGFFAAPASAEARTLLTLWQEEGFAKKLREESNACGFPRNDYIFCGALLAVCAARALDSGNAVFALSLAQEATSYSQMDGFAQEVILKAHHALDPRLPSIEETEDWLKTRFCLRPFTMIETTTSGEFYRCCPSYLPLPIGRMETKDVGAVLNSSESRRIKDSILDGSFRYCSKLVCPFIGGRTLMSRAEGLAQMAVLPETPETIVFSHDLSCNLSCPSCRKERIVIPKDEQERFDSLTEDVLLPLMDKAKTINICGSGDPFASIHFRNLLIRYCRTAAPQSKRLLLQTNGVLCDAKAWESMGLEGHVREVQISIDAATPDTYAVLRRGGDFNRLKDNLGFLSALRRTGRIDQLILRFVVQAPNFREMPAFAHWGIALSVDGVQFSQLRNWGTFAPEAYAQACVTLNTHKDHAAFLALLEDPIFNHPVVQMGDIQNFRVPAQENS